MPGENKTLFLFTAGYPYGTRDEPFLENEIEYLSEAFQKVVIFPVSKPTEEYRSIPKNVSIDDSLINIDTSKKKLTILSNLLFVLKVVTPSSIKLIRVIRFWKNIRVNMDILSTSIIRGKSLESRLKNTDLSNVIFYDYWFVNSIFSIGYLKTKRSIHKFICRAHRYDIYDNNWPTINVPFFEYRIKTVDELYLISKDGYNYVRNRTPNKFKQKLNLSYLGVSKPTIIQKKIEDKEKYVIVSCARVVDFKRIHKIPFILKDVDLPIKWIHFGDGPLFEELKNNLKELPENIEVELKGHVSNYAILDFYKKNSVNALLSISLSEGLPVSMMEAIGHGIPIVAINAGGISEIVSSKSGILIPIDASYQEIAESLNRYLKEKLLSKNEIIDYFDVHFNAEQNYNSFVQKMKTNQLSSGTQ